VEPISTIYLDAEEGGKVEQILIEEGEMVKAGDVILKLKNNDLTLNIMNSESNLAYHTNELRNTRIQMEQQKIANRQQLNQTDFELKRLERTYRQQKNLYADKLIAYEDYLRAEEEYEFKKQDRDLIYRKLVQDSIFRENQKHAMDENLVNMQANLSMVQQRLQDLDVKAPVDGQLGLLKAQIGESIGKGQRIGQVNVLTSYKITAMVDEHYIDRIRPGLPATIERNDKTLNLVVKKVYPEVRSGQFEIDLVFEVPARLFTCGLNWANLEKRSWCQGADSSKARADSGSLFLTR
jgi:HlyD family secretion protein